ncbi:MAG: YceI family protein [Bacteroidetes bacterium]|nr:YceI family protein [Bacteroidota bacterium]
MKTTKIIFISLIPALCITLFSFRIIISKWTVDTKDAKISFDMPEGNKSGTIGNLSGTFEFDPMMPEKTVITAKVEVSTIETGISKLNEHLQTADFFDAANHPEISFTSTSVSKTDSGFVAMGKLAMRDSVHAISVPFKVVDDGTRSVFKGSMDIFAGDYGVGKKSPTGKDRVLIVIEVPISKE